MKRIISIKGTEEEIIEICERISKLGIDYSFDAKANYSENNAYNSARIKIFGDEKYKLVEDHKNILNIIDTVHNKYNKDAKGLFEYKLNDLKYPVNKDLVLDTLTALKINFKYLKDENVIKCEHKIEEINSILKDILDIYSELNFYNIGSKPVKNVITLAAYITGRDIDELIEEGLEKELFREEDEKIVLNKDIYLTRKELLSVKKWTTLTLLKKAKTLSN